MAASKTLTFDIFGRDRSASKTIGKVSAAANGFGSSLGKLGGLIGTVFTARAIVQFGSDSVRAFADAEQAQAKLTDAFERFPLLADTNIKAFQKLNTQLAQKTRFDDDATASGQAVLAQFGLTGAQITKLTPLLQDYAAKTGKDLPTAAEDLGKAFLGQARALKAIGVDFQDTGTLAGNFDSVVASLTEKVGGFAEKEATTAAGKLEILRNRFGEIQEKIGAALLPALTEFADFFESDMMPAVETFANWLSTDGIPAFTSFTAWLKEFKDILGPAAIAIGVLTAAQWALNVAMAANPVGLVIIALGAAIALSAALATNFGGLTTTLIKWGADAANTMYGIGASIATFFEGIVNGVINTALGPLNFIRKLFGQPELAVNFTGISDGIKTAARNSQALSDAGLGSFGQAPSGGNGGGKVFALAAGGVVRATPGGVDAVIGEGGSNEAVIPLTPQVLGDIGRGIASASGGGTGGGPTFHITNPDPYVVVNAVMQRLHGKLVG